MLGKVIRPGLGPPVAVILYYVVGEAGQTRPQLSVEPAGIVAAVKVLVLAAPVTKSND